MLTALVGIITIQALWIKGNIDDRKKELTTHVNDALNSVNEEIRDDESMFILEQRFGDVDSLMNNLVHEDSLLPKQIKVHIDQTHKHSDGEDLIVIENSPDKTSITINDLAGLEDSMKSFERKMEKIGESFEKWGEGIEEWGENLGKKLEHLDEHIEKTVEEFELDEEHVEHISKMVEHFTFEMLLSDDLKDRIEKTDLEKKIRKGLKKEGLSAEFEYAVYNLEDNTVVPGYISKGFEKDERNDAYSKLLFEKDRKDTSFKLYVQLNNPGSYIWGNVWWLTLLSIIFTILITTAFGYALHLIYKQKKISQVKNDFINNMTHELKTPLASISLATSSIKHPRVIGNQKEIERFTDIIDSEKQRIKSHIDRVLEMAALDSGDFTLKLEEVDLVHVIETAMKNVDLSIQEVGGNIRFEQRVSKAIVQGDLFHLTNVITNVLDNSIKYRRDSLEITVIIETSGNGFTIQMIDNGIGMSSNEQKLAFDKFYRAESGDVHNIKGFGLGLSYVKSIIEKHNGEVDLISTKNKGTTIIITIPQ